MLGLAALEIVCALNSCTGGGVTYSPAGIRCVEVTCHSSDKISHLKVARSLEGC